MDYLPQNPAILVSSINMLLRDEEFDSLEALCYDEEFDSLEALCYAFNQEPEQIKSYLFANGFVWSEDQQQFRPMGYDTRT